VIYREPVALSPSTVVARDPDILFEDVGGELVMLSIRSGKYFGLDPVGTEVWRVLAEPRSIEDLCAALTEIYDVDGETCFREVSTFVEALVRGRSVVVTQPL
jgi:hypothetical protein